MKLKKVLICALSISLLAACGNQEAEEKPAEEPKAVEETQTEVKEEAKPKEKEEIKEAPVKEDESSEAVEKKENIEETSSKDDSTIAVKTHDLISGGGEKVGTMSVSIAQESQITDEYIKQWFEKVDKMDNNYDILISAESMDGDQAHGVWRMSGGMVFKNVYFEKDENGIYTVSNSDDSEYVDTEN